MIITEAELRELWRDGKGRIPAFPAGTQFSPAARDFLRTHQLEIQIESAPGPAVPPTSGGWDKPAAFPVVLSGPSPVCDVCGQPIHHKPETLTQLDAQHFALKTHPRIKLRGRLDSLHALILLAAAEARRFQLAQLADALDTLAAYTREIQSAEYHTRAVQPLGMLGKTEDELHHISHWPDQALGLPHLTLGSTDHTIVHWLNLVRTQAREVEIQALEWQAAPDLVRALNRLSSAVYVLELLFQSGHLRWHPLP